MIGLSEIVVELISYEMFKSIESVDYFAISKDHIGDIETVFNNQVIKAQGYNNDDAESVAKKIINSAKW